MLMEIWEQLGAIRPHQYNILININIDPLTPYTCFGILTLQPLDRN